MPSICLTAFLLMSCYRLLNIILSLMTIFIQKNSRIEIQFIDDKNILSKVLILTFYFLLLGNNAQTSWESSIISGTMDFIALWGRDTNYSKSFVCHYPLKILVLFLIITEILKEKVILIIHPSFLMDWWI